jgi:hypothetical protein
VIASPRGDPSNAPIRIADGVSLFILEDQGVFFSVATQELQLFNPPAAYVWCCLEEGLAPYEIIAGYVAAFGVDETESSKIVYGLLHRWQGMGYIDGIDVPPPAAIDFTTALARLLANPALRAAFAAAPETTAERLAVRETDRAVFVGLDPNELEFQAQTLANKKKKFRHRKAETGNAATASFLRRLQTHAWEAPSRTHFYRLLDTMLCLRFSTAEQEDWVHPALTHVEIEGTAQADITLDVIEEHSGHVVVMDGDPVARCDHGNQLTREVLIIVRDTTINRTDFFLQIHAGVVSNGSHGVMLPAAAGGGKSTLTAALVNRGFRYLTDEIALLQNDTLDVRPVPFAITVKPGSLAPLSTDYPHLADSPRHRREDEQDVVYLIPPEQNRYPANGAPLLVRWIVFPRYGTDETTALRPLGKAEALSRLLSECLVVPKDLDRDSVAALIAWFSQTECFELPFSSLAEAAGLLRDLCLEDASAG